MNEITKDEGILHDTKQQNFMALYRHSKSRQHLRVRQWLKGQKLHGLKEHEYPSALMENARGYKKVEPETNEWTVTERMLRTVVAEVKVNYFQFVLSKFPFAVLGILWTLHLPAHAISIYVDVPVTRDMKVDRCFAVG